ncbi:MAG: DNA mismatch repair protein MutS [Pseudomonadota bacterium]
MAQRPSLRKGDASPGDSSDARGATPAIAQYLEIKTANPDSLLWYRMGDFYELFFEDAVVASQALGIVLTKRGKYLGEDIPMCGVPVHRADEYLQRLIRVGHRVAVCEQLEDPAEARKRGPKAVVRRDVVRLVTPGTLTEEALLDANARNYLTALFLTPKQQDEEAAAAFASFDLSTGELEVGEVASVDLASELGRLAPREVLVSDGESTDSPAAEAVSASNAAITFVPAQTFNSLAGESQLRDGLGVLELSAFGTFSRGELAAVGALLRYVSLTQVGQRPVIQPPKRAGRDATLVIDAASRASLELVRSSSGDRRGSLLSAIDRTVTGPGARELAARIASPLVDSTLINRRLDAVGLLTGDVGLRERLRQRLRGAPDVARAVSRLSLQRGGPRDLAAIRDGLAAARDLANDLRSSASGTGLPDVLADVLDCLNGCEANLFESLSQALVDEPPPYRRDGGFVREGYDESLDQARQLRNDSRKVMASLESKYSELAGIKSLKIKHNNVLGYFVEVTAGGASTLLAAPLSDVFRHRQTMANAVRFTTEELVEIEGQISSAGERSLALEQEIFLRLSHAVASGEVALTRMAAALGELDCLAGLAELASEQNYVRPDVKAAGGLVIKGGRHPVVEQALATTGGGPFIENDCALGDDGGIPRPPGFEQVRQARIWLVTGPNMAGKSTFLRQNALIVLMAQMGAFVPAQSVSVGVVDRLFSRVGASDDLARGRSTFMVEMVETAAILNQATERSLVILDEIGRGTATFDGLSIAWATVEYLHDVLRCRALFATHYHELTALNDRLNAVANVTIDVKEWQDEIVFLHSVRPGAADRSYGIQVAKLAGLPAPVIQRAGDVLKRLESGDQGGRSSLAGLDDLPLFSAVRPAAHIPAEPAASPVEAALADVRPDELSPKAALDLVYALVRLMEKA